MKIEVILMKNQLLIFNFKIEEINSFLTYNYGMDDDRFPLSFITEGQGSHWY